MSCSGQTSSLCFRIRGQFFRLHDGKASSYRTTPATTALKVAAVTGQSPVREVAILLSTPLELCLVRQPRSL
jgi:hypothetical protein